MQQDIASAITSPVASVVKVAVDEIRPGNNDRTTFEQAALDQLAASIRDHGLLQPISLRPVRARKGTRYEIVAGERRFRAMTEVLGWTEVPAIVEKRTAREASALMLTENMARVDLNPIEEARAYAARIDAGEDIATIAAWAGVAEFRVAWRLDLLKLADRFQEAVECGVLPIGAARQMASLDANRQQLAWAFFQRHNPTPSQFGEVVERLAAEAGQDSMFDADAFLQAEEWKAEQEKAARRATRSQLVDLLAAALEELPAGDLSDRIAAALDVERDA